MKKRGRTAERPAAPVARWRPAVRRPCSLAPGQVRLWLGVGAAVLGAAILLIPVSRTALDFSRAPHPTRAQEGASNPTDALYRELRWHELMPPHWDPYQQLGQLDQRIRSTKDRDATAQALQRHLREVWDHAPINPALDGVAVRLPGFVVPLDETPVGLSSFLLVPYFGACIHSPPPPSNQIVHVVAHPPVRGVHAMDTVWVSGTLQAARQDSVMGMSSYHLQAHAVVRYVPASQR